MRYSKATKAFLITEIIYGVGMGALHFVMNLHFADAGLTDKQIGSLLGIQMLLIGIFAIPSGSVAGVIGRKNMMTTGMICIGISTFLLIALPSNLWIIAIVLMAVGLVAVEVCEVQLLYEGCVSDEEKLEAYNLVIAAFIGGTGIGIAFSGFISDVLLDTFWHYRAALAVSSTIILIAAFLRVFFLSPGIVKASKKRDKKQWKSHFSVLFLVLIFLAFIQGAEHNFVAPFNNLILRYMGNFSDSMISMILTILSITVFLFSGTANWLVKSFGDLPVLVFFFLLNALLSLVFLIPLEPAVLTALFILRGGTTVMLYNLVVARMFLILDSTAQDLFAGIRSVVRNGGSALAVYLTGFYLEKKDYSMPFVLSAVTMGMGAVLFFALIFPKIQKPDPQNEAMEELNA